MQQQIIGGATVAQNSDVVIPEFYHDLIQSIVSALEARDPHTAEHSLRVGDMVEKTCQLMGLSYNTTTMIHMAAHVHDIGKIGLPDAVLIRRTRLSSDQHQLLKEHSRVGFEILRGCESLKDVAHIVLHHHEHWDGSGYPLQLSGEEIPFGARLVCLCDSIDAMLGKRMSSKSMTVEECKHEIEANKGHMYDPYLTSFVLKHWEEIVTPIDFKDTIKRSEGAFTPLSCNVHPYQQSQIA